jgi:hypothetical protein
MSWLRHVVADFFCAGDGECDEQARQARRELEQLRAVAVLAVAQARRTELELRDVMAASEGPGRARLAELVPKLEAERERAQELVERTHRREREETERLARLGDLRTAEEINRRRDDLRATVNRMSRTGAADELARMEDEARAEAFRLDLLESLDAGKAPEAPAPQGSSPDLAERARRLLAQPPLDEQSER